MKKGLFITLAITFILSGMSLTGCGGERVSSPLSSPQTPPLTSSSPKPQNAPASVNQNKQGYITLKWQQEIGAPRLIINDGVAYARAIGSEGPKLYAIDATSGKILRSVRVESSSYLIGSSDEVIFLGDEKSRSLKAFDMSRLAQLWTKEYQNYSLDFTRKGVWAYEQGFYFDNLSSKPKSTLNPPREPRSFMLDPLSGEPLWESKQWEGILCEGRSTFYIGTAAIDRSLIQRLDSGTGKIIWSRSNVEDYSYLTPLAEVNNNLLVRISASEGQWLGSLDIVSAEFKWKTKLEGEDWPNLTLALVTSKMVVVWTDDIPGQSVFYGIELNTGKVVWEKWFKNNYNSFAAPVLQVRHTGENEFLLITKCERIGETIGLSVLDYDSGEEIPIDISKESVMNMLIGLGGGGNPSVLRGNYYKNMLIIGDDTGLKGYQMTIKK